MQDKHLSPLDFLHHYVDIIAAMFLASFIADPLKLNGYQLGVVFIIITVIWDILAYCCFTYSIEDKQIVIKKGVIFKKVIHVPYARIQSIEHSQFVLFKIFDVERLQINNASKSNDADQVVLNAVKAYVGAILEEKHKQYQNQPVNDVDDEIDGADVLDADDDQSAEVQNYAQYKITIKDIALYTFSSFRVLLVLFVIAQITHGDLIDLIVDIYQRELNSNPLTIIGIVLLSIVVTLLLSFIYTMALFYDFTLVKEGKYLEYEKGLVTRKKVRLPTDRIQSVLVEQNVMGKLLKIMTIKIIMASDGDDDESSQAVVLPILNNDKFTETMNDFFEWLPLKAVEKYGARKRAAWLFFRNVSWILLIVPAVIYFIGWTSLSFWLVILEVLVFIYIIGNAYFKYRFTSLGLTGDSKDDYLVVSESILFRQTTYYVGWHEIQSMHFDSSVFMEKNNLSHVAVRIRKGKDGELTGADYIDYDGGKRIYDWYRQ